MGAVLTGMVGSEDLRVDSPEAQGLCPAEEGRGRDAAATDKVAAIDELPARLRARWGACYACGMGVGGMVLVELSSTLSDVARSMGTTETALSGVFLARGAGALLGAAVSARVLFAGGRPGHRALAGTQLLLALFVAAAAFARAPVLLYAAWFCVGASAAALDTGCQIMTRKVRGALAGPWLGLNTVCFALAAALVPLLEMMARDVLATQYLTLAALCVLSAAFVASAPHPEDPAFALALAPRAKPDRAAGGGGGEHRWVEIALSCSVFCLIGTIVDLTTYIQTYVKASGVTTTGRAPDALLVVWVSITLGRLVGLGDQWRLRRHGDGRVYAHAASSLATGALGMALLAASDAQTNSRTFWVGVALYGLGNGPCIGYCYELLNRLTVASDEGMSIMNVGLNLGASLVPYITSKIWASTALSYHAIIWIPFLLMVLPLPFMALARVAAAHQAAPAAVV